MCTLLAVVPAPGGVLQVAANRDEFLARPASPPQRWPEARAVLAPRDEQALGTWLGVNAQGLFVGVTNRHGLEHDARLASRGQLVKEALSAGSVEQLHRRLGGLGPRDYNPFHLLYADASGRAGLTFSDGQRVEQRWLSPGLHVLTERSLGAGDESARVTRAQRALTAGRGMMPLEAWADVLRVHAEPEVRDGTCIHAPALGYGTRSSFLLQLASGGSGSRCLWTLGPPCTSPWVDGTALLQDVLLEGHLCP
ncbi:MAG: NRDE family protein [Myxococcaceae bacterium]